MTDRYDPLLAKLIVHGPDRSGALAALQGALDETRVLGVRTNLAFLRWLIEQPTMRDGEMRTDTIDQMASARTAASRRRGLGRCGGRRRCWRLLPGDSGAAAGAPDAPAAVRLRHDQEERRVELGAMPADRPRGRRRRRRGAVHVDVEGQSLEFSHRRRPDRG